MKTRPDLGIYDAVWGEEQNATLVSTLRRRLDEGNSLVVTLQPGDVTRYEIELAPVIPHAEHRVEISHDGRDPRFGYGVSSTPSVIVRVLNEGFATQRHALFRGVGFVSADEVQLRLGIRNECTAWAVAATINELWAG